LQTGIENGFLISSMNFCSYLLRNEAMFDAHLRS
jgi:hypothetical protein